MNASTRERLLLTARDLLLRGGPQSATVRALTAGASANVAAVNYHFGSRSGLLREVLLGAARELTAAWEELFASATELSDDPYRTFAVSLTEAPGVAALLIRTLVAPEDSISRLVAAELAEGIEPWVGYLWARHPARTRQEVHSALVRALIGLLPLVADRELIPRLGAGRYRSPTTDTLIAGAARSLEETLTAPTDPP